MPCLADPINTFDSFKTQSHHIEHICKVGVFLHIVKKHVQLSPRRALASHFWSHIYVAFCKQNKKMMWEVPGLLNKLKVLMYGPGWAPGKPRLGLMADIPDGCCRTPQLNRSEEREKV